MRRSFPLRFGPDPFVLGDGVVDRLLDGVEPDDAPPGYAQVAALLCAVRAPATPDELEGESIAVARYRVVQGARPLAPEPAAHRPARRKLTVGAVVTFASLSLVSATSAAAATNSLPSPAQRAAHVVLSAVGVNVPEPHTGHPDGSGSTASGSAGRVGQAPQGATTSATPGRPPVGNSAAGNSAAGSGTAGSGTAGSGTVGNSTVGNSTAGSGTANHGGSAVNGGTAKGSGRPTGARAVPGPAGGAPAAGPGNGHGNGNGQGNGNGNAHAGQGGGQGQANG